MRILPDSCRSRLCCTVVEIFIYRRTQHCERFIYADTCELCTGSVKMAAAAETLKYELHVNVAGGACGNVQHITERYERECCRNPSDCRLLTENTEKSLNGTLCSLGSCDLVRSFAFIPLIRASAHRDRHRAAVYLNV